MDPTRRALSGLLLAVAVPAGVAAAILLALVAAALLHLRVVWELGKLLARGVWAAAGLPRRERWPQPDASATPATRALPRRR
jgi:uncharacterized membrane protein